MLVRNPTSHQCETVPKEEDTMARLTSNGQTHEVDVAPEVGADVSRGRGGDPAEAVGGGCGQPAVEAAEERLSVAPVSAKPAA